MECVFDEYFYFIHNFSLVDVNIFVFNQIKLVAW